MSVSTAAVAVVLVVLLALVGACILLMRASWRLLAGPRPVPRRRTRPDRAPRPPPPDDWDDEEYSARHHH
jgi:hypothetical protein